MSGHLLSLHLHLTKTTQKVLKNTSLLGFNSAISHIKVCHPYTNFVCLFAFFSSLQPPDHQAKWTQLYKGSSRESQRQKLEGGYVRDKFLVKL